MDEFRREPLMGLRISIIGIRTPITGLRTPIKLEDVVEPDMNWDTQYKKLNNYIKYVAGQVVSGLPSAMMSAEDLYQEGLILLYNCFEKYKFKTEKEFHAIFKASCWRLLKGFCYKKKELQQVDLDTVYDLGYDDNAIIDMYEEFRIQQVVELLAGDQTAINILKEIISPSEKTVYEMQMDYYRKECLKAQGKKSCVPSEMEIKPVILRKSLGLTEKEFSTAFKKLQSEVYAVYAVDCDIKSYQESDSMSDEEFDSIYSNLMKTVKQIKTA